MEIEFAEDIRPEKVMVSLNTVLPEGIKVTEAVVSEGTASLTSLIRWSHYEIRLWVKNEADRTTLADKLKGWDDLDSVFIDKKKKRGKNKISVRVDIKPLIGNLQFKDFDQDGFAVLGALLKTGEEGNLKPSDLAEALETHLSLGIDLEMTQIKRLDAFVEKDGKIEKPI
jgi:radical SAM-linked protein